jgi:hypothetical protein
MDRKRLPIHTLVLGPSAALPLARLGLDHHLTLGIWGGALSNRHDY